MILVIKMLVMDVDGTLTDGKIYMGDTGEIMKAFCAHDAVGVRKLQINNIIPVIITGRASKIVEKRAIEMDMDLTCVFQGVSNKLKKLEELSIKYGFNLNEIAYIGDDENDLECIKKCGLRGCPNDAVLLIKNECNFISKYNAGEGAVREFVEYIIENNQINIS